MNDQELYRCLARVAIDKEFRALITENPEAALKEFTLDRGDQDALLARDERVFEMLGRALRASGNFSVEEPAGQPEPREDVVEFQEISLPPINLTLFVQPYAQQDRNGQLVVNYAAHIQTGDDSSPEKRPPGMEGQPLPPLKLHVHSGAAGIQKVSNGELGVRYDVVAEQAPALEFNHSEKYETSPVQPDLKMRRAPNPWKHRVNAPDVKKAAAAVLSSPADERYFQLKTLVGKLTNQADSSPSNTFPVSLPGPPDIWIVGLGMKPGVHITEETRDVLSRVEQVLFVDTGIGTREFLESLCPRVRSLFTESYTESDIRLNAYQHMATSVIEAALVQKPVAFAMQGHPVVGSYASVLIYDLAVSLGLRVRILPGLCHIDALFSELLLDPFIQGVQAYEATDLLLRRRPLHSDVPALLFQVGNVETRLYTDRISCPGRMQRLREHLERYYPAGHQVQAVYTSPHILAPSSGYTFELAHINDYAHVLHPGFTLFIPPVTDRPVVDPILVQQIDSPAHLHNITVDCKRRSL